VLRRLRALARSEEERIHIALGLKHGWPVERIEADLAALRRMQGDDRSDDATVEEGRAADAARRHAEADSEAARVRALAESTQHTARAMELRRVTTVGTVRPCGARSRERSGRSPARSRGSRRSSSSSSSSRGDPDGESDAPARGRRQLNRITLRGAAR